MEPSGCGVLDVDSVMTRESEASGAKQASTEMDASLLALVELGDQQAMARLFDRHSKQVYSVALRILGDPAAAEEVVQDIFMHLWRFPMSVVAARRSLARWLMIASRNRSIELLTKKRTTESVENASLPSLYDLADVAGRKVMLARVRMKMEELPGDQRTMLQLAFFGGWTDMEIAKRTGQPIQAVKISIRRELEVLRKLSSMKFGKGR